LRELVPVHLSFSIRILLTENRAAGKTSNVKKSRTTLDHIKMQLLGCQRLTTVITLNRLSVQFFHEHYAKFFLFLANFFLDTSNYPY